jgi:hypothetical protein
MRFSAAIAATLCGVLLAGACGCSRETSSRDVSTYDVRGKVIVNGQPAAGASVTLLPAEDADRLDQSPPTFLVGGLTDEQGEFTLRTNGEKPGAPAGYYLVGVSWPDPKVEPDRDGGERGPDLIPPRYRDPRQSGIEVEILPERAAPQELTVNLTY